MILSWDQWQLTIKFIALHSILDQQFTYLNSGVQMINMKKLVEETDFDNLAELTKRWGNSVHKATPAPAEKQNDSKMSNEIPSKSEASLKNEQILESNSTVQVKPMARKKQLVPQVIDEDTQHFKNKLEHLLNNFKTDAVSEFMSMKKEMLEYQQECVKTDTHKYLTMYEEKHKELLETKQQLLEVSREAEKKTAQVELLSDHIAKLNQRMKTYKFVSRPFSILYQNKVKGKELKFKMKEAAKFDDNRLKRKGLRGWLNLYKSEKGQRQQVENEQRVEKEVSDIVGKFQKEMELLKERLAEANRKNEEYQANKHILQENLKKAFLRGVCAMNMEAMGVLGTQNAEEADWISEKQKSERTMMANNLSYVEPKTNLMSRDQITQNQSMFLAKASNSRISNPISEHRSEAVMMSYKPESKNTKWKEAPIVGVEEMREEEEPRMQVVRPTTEGKVIKVVESRSAVEVKKVVAGSVAGSSRKKV